MWSHSDRLRARQHPSGCTWRGAKATPRPPWAPSFESLRTFAIAARCHGSGGAWTVAVRGRLVPTKPGARLTKLGSTPTRHRDRVRTAAAGHPAIASHVTEPPAETWAPLGYGHPDSRRGRRKPKPRGHRAPW